VHCTERLLLLHAQDNPEYGFLADGEGSAFYQYTLFSALSALAAQQHQQHQYQQQPPMPQQQQQHQYQPQPDHSYGQPPQPGQAYAQPQLQQASAQVEQQLPPDVVANWDTVLNQLTGSKVRGGPFHSSQRYWMQASDQASVASSSTLSRSAAHQDLQCHTMLCLILARCQHVFTAI